MRDKKIATGYLLGRGVNRAFNAGPGRKIEFHGGAAVVTDERIMPYLLRLPDIQVEIEQDWIERLPDWVSKCPVGAPPRAHVVCAGLPEYHIGPPPEYIPATPAKPRGRPPKQAETSSAGA